MRRKLWKAAARFLGTCFLLVLFGIVSSNLMTYAQLPETLSPGFVSSLDGCATNPACAEALGLTESVTSPTAAGTATAITTSEGVSTTSPGSFALLTRVAGGTTVAWFLWTEPLNDQAQKLAQKKYCAANPNDPVCVPFTGGQCSILYNVYYEFIFSQPLYSNDPPGTPVDSFGCKNITIYPGLTGFFGPQATGPQQAYGPIYDFKAVISVGDGYLPANTVGHSTFLGTMYTGTVQRWNYRSWSEALPSTSRVLTNTDAYGNPYDTFGAFVGGDCTDNCNGYGRPGMFRAQITSVSPVDPNVPDNCGNAPPLAWEDWPQDKRNQAFELIAPSDWDEFFKSVPKSGELPPGVTINVPKTGILGPDGKLRVLPGPYTNSDKPLKESDIYKKLNQKQQQRLDKLLQRKNNQGENVYDEDILKNGKLTDDKRKCYTVELGTHLGDEDLHNEYATYVTGSISDVLVVDQTGEPATFDGGIQPNSQAVLQVGPETEGAMAEVKTRHSWLNKTLPPILDSLSQEDKDKYLGALADLRKQLTRESGVANRCGLSFQIFFNEQVAANSAKQLSSQASLPIPLYSLINYIQYP